MSRTSSVSTATSNNTANSLHTTTTRSDNSSNIYYYYNSSSSKRCKIDDILKKFLSCHICKELYRQPKLLPCLHSFCSSCLVTYVPDHSLSLACPICRQHSILPVCGVSGLRENTFVSSLATQVRNFLGSKGSVSDVVNGNLKDNVNGFDESCETIRNQLESEDSPGLRVDGVSCTGTHNGHVDGDDAQESGGKNHVNEVFLLPSNPSENTAITCLQHENVELSYFCVDCETLICDTCIDVEHRDHKITVLSEFVVDEKSSLEKTLKKVVNHTKPLLLALRNVEKTQDKLIKQTLQAEQSINEHYERLIKAIEVRKSNLLTHLLKKSSEKKEILNKQKKNIENFKNTVDLCRESIENCLNFVENPVRIILAKKELQDSLEQFCLANVQLMPDENPFVSFDHGKLNNLEFFFKTLDDYDSEDFEKHETPIKLSISISEAETNSNKSPKNESLTSNNSQMLHEQTKPKSSGRILSTSSTISTTSSFHNQNDKERSDKTLDDEINDINVIPSDLGLILCNSAVAHETTASGESLKKCHLNNPARVVVTTKNAKGLVVSNLGAKLTAKISHLNASEATAFSDEASTCSSKRDRSLSVERNKTKKTESSENKSKHKHHTDENIKRKEDIVIKEITKSAKESRIRKNILVVPDISKIDEYSYEVTFTITENMIKPLHSSVHQTTKSDFAKSVATVSSIEPGRTTPRQFISPHKQTPKHLHSSLDKLQSEKRKKDEIDKKRPKSAQNTENTLEVVQLEINLHGQPICNSPFTIKIKPELPGNASKKANTSNRSSNNSVFLNSRNSAEVDRRKSSNMDLRTSFRTSPRPSHANRKPSSASASQNDGPCQRIGSKGHSKGEFINLQGIAVHEDRIAVADSNGQCVQIFSMEGDCLLKFGVKGRSPGQMQRPTSVTFTPDGQNILVSDYENKWIGIYNTDGKFLSRIGHGKLIGPKGVAIDAQGRVVIVDNKSSTVWLYNLSGKVLGKFGLKGIDPDSSSPPAVKNSYAEAHARMAGPHFCAIDPIDGDVVVTDFHNHKVKVFTSEGQYKFTFGSPGDGNGQFSAPTGVCIDNQGNILVADWGNSRVQIFDKNGSFLCFIDTSSDPLYGPQGIAMTKDNDIIVADSGNHCLKIYKQLL